MSVSSGADSSSGPLIELPSRPWNLAELVAALREGQGEARGDAVRHLETGAHKRYGRVLPSRAALGSAIDSLRGALFPAHFGAVGLVGTESRDDFVARKLDEALVSLHEQIRRGLSFGCDHHDRDCERCDRRAGDIIRDFATRLPDVRRLLQTDVWAAYHGDPAARSLDEAIVCYPGITAIVHHRVAHPLHVAGVPLLPRMIAEIAHSLTGIDIHPGAEIGESFFIDHGTGVVIGETALVGNRVRLYQGVTLGAKTFELDEQGHPVKGRPRHPIVEDDVVVYAGATILGRVTIGRGSRVGGNVWITRDVPPHSRITQAQAHSDTFRDGLGI